MPGTILVSVLEFTGLPSSSPLSSIAIKVSMGKVEYHTWDKGDFSFPLTTLRDNLIVLLQDADGNEISHAGVETRLIVEKGLWDDLFPLAGGGYVHMKLQFVLSEEERNRIRMMRYSALKKKHGELLSSSIGSSQSATTAGSDVASSLSFSHGVSDSQKSLLQIEAESVIDEASQAHLVLSPVNFKVEKSGTGNTEGINSEDKQLNPVKHFPLCRNDADRYQESSSTIRVPHGVDFHLIEVRHGELVEKNETKSPPDEVPKSAIYSDETSLSLEGSGSKVGATDNSIPPNLEEDGAHNLEKQSPLGKTLSNVRKMISAFESSLAQDVRSHIKPPPTKSQSTNTGIQDVLKNQYLEEAKTKYTKPARSISGRVINPFLPEESQYAPTYIRKREQLNLDRDLDGSTSFWDMGHLQELDRTEVQTKQMKSSLMNKLKVVPKEVNVEEEKSHEDLMRISTFETATISGRMLDGYSGRHQPSNLFTSNRDSCGKPSIEKSRREIPSKDLQGIIIRGSSPHKLESLVYSEDTHHFFETSGGWIFPYEARRLCVTTGGKLVMDLMGDYSIKPKVHQGISTPENMEERSVDGGTVVKVNKDEKTCHKIKSEPESSEDIEISDSGGPLGQATKVAIMVGFGILVLLTRQRNNR